MNKRTIDLADLVITAFINVFYQIIDCVYDRIVLKGGRNSTKSSVIALAIIIGVIKHNCSAVCMVKYDNKVFDRLVSTFNEMMARANVSDRFKYKVQAKEFVLLDRNGRETQFGIKFTGVDDPAKLKSFKPRSGTGGFRYIWFEEAYDFASNEEITNIIDTMGRGSGKHCVIISYNPPKSRTNWLNKLYSTPSGKVLSRNKNCWVNEFEVKVPMPDGSTYVKVNKQLVHHSTYLDVLADGHPDWLGETLVNAEKAKQFNDKEYRWVYLGEPVGEEGTVFNNVHNIDDTVKFDKTYLYRGLDFGFAKDPCAFVIWSYDKVNRYIYCCGEFGGIGLSNQTLASEIRAHNTNNFTVWADCAEPRTINELNTTHRLKLLPVSKGADSVRHGIKWLQGLNGIFIDPVLYPNTYKEFSEYEYKKNKLGEYTGELPDSDNHYIDASRYALNTEIK